MKIERNGKMYVKCEMCEKFATFDNCTKLGWDWFTGYLSRTHHYCAAHKTSESRNSTFDLSRIKPERPE